MRECRHCGAPLHVGEDGRPSCPEHGALRAFGAPATPRERQRPRIALRAGYLAALPDQDLDELLRLALSGHLEDVERRLLPPPPSSRDVAPPLA